MTKTGILDQIRAALKSRYERIVGAATEARSYATDEDSRAESKYDTRGLEASYLAAGQAAKADELAGTIRIFSALNLPDLGPEEPIRLGALVRVRWDGSESCFLLAPQGGGLTFEHDGSDLTVLTPGSPLFQKLEGLTAGDRLDDPEMVIVAVS